MGDDDRLRIEGRRHGRMLAHLLKTDLDIGQAAVGLGVSVHPAGHPTTGPAVKVERGTDKLLPVD